MKDKKLASEYSVCRLKGIDDLGRKVLPISSFNHEKKVGMFYFLWAGQEEKFEKTLFDIQKILDSGDTSQLEKEDDFATFYYAGEPLYGYYNMQDRWVLKRHMELLTLAGVDFICMDCTNVKIYAKVARALFPIMQEFLKQGFNVPKVTFYTNSYSGTTVKHLYETYYKDGLYDDIWYRIDDKPLIIGVTKDNNNASDQYPIIKEKNDFIDPKYMDYFTVKESQWPSMYDFNFINENAIPWMSWRCPQHVHSGGYIAVPVAQHGHAFGKTSVSLMQPESSRGYNNYTKKIEKDKVKSGLSYQQMWDNAIKNDKVKTAFVCGFNEWMAQKQGDHYPELKGQFVDVYNHEFSRDIEPMRAGYKDNFYIQTIINIRRFKGEINKSEDKNRVINSVDIFSSNVKSDFINNSVRFVDFMGDTEHRDFCTSANENVNFKYVNNTGRNDITDIYVCNDSENLYIAVGCESYITEREKMDYSWMNLYLGINDENSFHGFNYLINRIKTGENKCSIDKYNNGAFSYFSDAKYRVDNNYIYYEIPLSKLGATANDLSVMIKVSDNVKNPSDVMSFYESGDSAPLGRLGFLYGDK